MNAFCSTEMPKWNRGVVQACLSSIKRLSQIHVLLIQKEKRVEGSDRHKRNNAMRGQTQTIGLTQIQIQRLHGRAKDIDIQHDSNGASLKRVYDILPCLKTVSSVDKNDSAPHMKACLDERAGSGILPELDILEVVFQIVMLHRI